MPFKPDELKGIMAPLQPSMNPNFWNKKPSHIAATIVAAYLIPEKLSAFLNIIKYFLKSIANKIIK